MRSFKFDRGIEIPPISHKKRKKNTAAQKAYNTVEEMDDGDSVLCKSLYVRDCMMKEINSRPNCKAVSRRDIETKGYRVWYVSADIVYENNNLVEQRLHAINKRNVAFA